MLNAGGDETEQARITNLKGATDQYYNAAIDAERRLYDAKVRTNDLNNSLSARQIAYADVFKKTFESMGDAIADFTKTGKLDFAGLIDSMLMDLLRYELRLQMLALYQAMRPGLMAGVSWLGGGTGGSYDSTGGASITPGTAGAYAKGGVFDAGLQMFAKGGAFTNKIINSPTLFANGGGLMGEAGPEAIMPLKRDSSGNLGVRTDGNSGKVDVVVNNYGNQHATATETTDSRGNRRVEVTIGDVTAGEMNRSGSAPQKSLRNTYGIQPQLIRR
jgi:lambda family phage tail tape measure protein